MTNSFYFGISHRKPVFCFDSNDNQLPLIWCGEMFISTWRSSLFSVAQTPSLHIYTHHLIFYWRKTMTDHSFNSTMFVASDLTAMSSQKVIVYRKSLTELVFTSKGKKAA